MQDVFLARSVDGVKGRSVGMADLPGMGPWGPASERHGWPVANEETFGNQNIGLQS